MGVYCFILVFVYISPQAYISEILQYFPEQKTSSMGWTLSYSLFIILGGFNRENINYELTKYIHIRCPNRETNILD